MAPGMIEIENGANPTTSPSTSTGTGPKSSALISSSLYLWALPFEPFLLVLPRRDSECFPVDALLFLRSSVGPASTPFSAHLPRPRTSISCLLIVEGVLSSEDDDAEGPSSVDESFAMSRAIFMLSADVGGEWVLRGASKLQNEPFGVMTPGEVPEENEIPSKVDWSVEADDSEDVMDMPLRMGEATEDGRRNVGPRRCQRATSILRVTFADRTPLKSRC